MEPSALKHWIVAGISLDKTHRSTGIVSADPELYRFLGPVFLGSQNVPRNKAGVPGNIRPIPRCKTHSQEPFKRS